MSEIPPIGPVSYALGSLSPTDFELLCWRIVALEHPSVVFLDNPDGGADALLPSDDGVGYVRVWQAKRFTSSIKWVDCEDSLDVAVTNYRIPHVTFCFARNLTGPQEKTFNKRLARRRAGVRVDWVGAAVLSARLTGSRDGEVIARHFFTRPFYEQERLERAIALGGKVDTVDQKLGHLQYVHESMDDAYFDTSAVIFRTGRDAPIPPGTMMSVIDRSRDRTSRIDVIPKDSQAMSLFAPRFTLGFTDDDAGRIASAALAHALSRNEAATINGGIVLTFDQYPRFLADEFGEPLLPDVLQIEPSERVERAPRPWLIELRIEDDEDVEPVPMELVPTHPADGWDYAFVGSTGGLTVNAAFRRLGDKAEMSFRFQHQRDTSPVGDQIRVLKLLLARQAGGTFGVVDRAGTSETLRMGPTEQKFTGPGFAKLLEFMEAVAFIEQATAVPLALPETLRPEDYNHALTLARELRVGEANVGFSSFAVDVDDAGLQRIHDGGRLVLPYPELTATVLGSTIPLQGFLNLHPYVVESIEPSAEADGMHTVTIGAPPGHTAGYAFKVEPRVVGQTDRL